MAGRNLLLVVLAEAPPEALQAVVAERGDGLPRVHVVAPAHVTALEWLATDEDDARREAEVRALAVEWSLADEADVEGEAGEFDAVLAVEDALRRFPADELLVVGADAPLVAALRRFGLPVTPVPSRPAPGRRDRPLLSGRSIATPFVFFAGANLALLAIAVVISLVVLLVLWLR